MRVARRDPHPHHFIFSTTHHMTHQEEAEMMEMQAYLCFPQNHNLLHQSSPPSSPPLTMDLFQRFYTLSETYSTDKPPSITHLRGIYFCDIVEDILMVMVITMPTPVPVPIRRYRLLMMGGLDVYLTYAIEHDGQIYLLKSEACTNPVPRYMGYILSGNVLPPEGSARILNTRHDAVAVTRKVYLNDSPLDDFTRNWAPNLHYMEAEGCPIPRPPCACCQRTRLVAPLPHHSVVQTITNYIVSYPEENVTIELNALGINISHHLMIDSDCGYADNHVRNQISMQYDNDDDLGSRGGGHRGSIRYTLNDLETLIRKHKYEYKTYLQFNKGLFFQAGGGASASTADADNNEVRDYYPKFVTDETLWLYPPTGMMKNVGTDYWVRDYSKGACDYSHHPVIRRLFEIRDQFQVLYRRHVMKDKKPRVAQEEGETSVTSSPDVEEPCKICLEPDNHEKTHKEWISLNACGHKFHADCVRPFLLHQFRCPYCRTASAPDSFHNLVPIQDVRNQFIQSFLERHEIKILLQELLHLIKTVRRDDLAPSPTAATTWWMKLKTWLWPQPQQPESEAPVTEENREEWMRIKDLYTNKTIRDLDYTLIYMEEGDDDNACIPRRYVATTIKNYRQLLYETSSKDEIMRIASAAWGKPIVEIESSSMSLRKRKQQWEHRAADVTNEANVFITASFLSTI